MCRSVSSQDEVLCVQCLLFRDVCEAEGSDERFSASQRRDSHGGRSNPPWFPWKPLERLKMAALLPEILFQCDGQAPAPSKDFYQLLVSRKQVIVRWWKISLRSEFRETKPGELKISHEDFVDDSTLNAQLGIIFGKKTLSYVIDLCRGRYDFLERLPESLILYILTFLDLEDIAQLSQVSHTFQKICNSDKLWEHIVERSCDRVTPEMRSLAQDLGWKQFFFTNKLQLQLKLRRRRKRQEREDIFMD